MSCFLPEVVVAKTTVLSGLTMASIWSSKFAVKLMVSCSVLAFFVVDEGEAV